MANNNTAALVSLFIALMLLTSYSTVACGCHCDTCAHCKPTAPLVRVDFYVMSRCPDTKACIEQFAEAIEELHNIMEFHLYFIATEDLNYHFESKLSATDVLGDQVWLCAQRQSSSVEQFIEFLLCTLEQQNEIPFNAMQCCNRVGLAWEPVEKCVELYAGELLDKNLKEQNKLNRQDTSCTINMNDLIWCQRDQGM
jgi:hypothetical protein